MTAIYFFMTAFAMVLAIYFFYPLIDIRIKKYLESLPEEVHETSSSSSVGTLEEPVSVGGGGEDSTKGIAALEFIKRTGLYFTQPFIHSFYST